MIERIIVFFASLIFECLLTSLPTYLLWNWLMPEIFSLKEITILQAFGLLFLSSIIFKSFSK